MSTRRPPSGSAISVGVPRLAVLACVVGVAGLIHGGPALDKGLSPVVLPASFRVSRPATLDEPVEVVVVMADGSRYTGTLMSQSDDQVVLDVAGIELCLRRAEIARIDTLPSVAERYQRLRASIADDDIQALLGLVNWLVSRGELDLAEQELLDVLRQEPRHPRALDAHRLIQAQRALEATPASPSNPDPEPEGSAVSDRRGKDAMPVLSEDEINLIRVYELDLRRAPRIMIRRETVERLIEEYSGDPLIPATVEGREDLLRAARSDPARVVEIIFRLKARHLYSEIRVVENPRSMQMFRERVHGTWMINSCATCHNLSPDAPPGPQFITRRPNSDATVYSNFLILDRYRLPDGSPLIRYDDPTASPLIHLAMPRALSDHPHPDTAASRGWSPVLLSTNTVAYQNAINWIRSMYLPRPEYPIEYPPQADTPQARPAPIER